MAYPTLLTSRTASHFYANRGNFKIAFILKQGIFLDIEECNPFKRRLV
ncbi:hypothetical protein T4D_4988 [Trichinella pseudospiralis]|uniref:Uncharacterized protein n=1 Tax=Trichinella pseudospiralis TaxID=6337 RepID=A0A0V1F4U2_TRIPS|nr:hypothetical protein T4D_4988 [Trichinella pseudospiralis]